MAVAAAVVGAAAACAVVALVVRQRIQNSDRWVQVEVILREFEERCAAPIGKLRHDAMAVEMHAGLASEGGSKLKMLISYVDNLPTGLDKDWNLHICVGDYGVVNFDVSRDYVEEIYGFGSDVVNFDVSWDYVEEIYGFGSDGVNFDVSWDYVEEIYGYGSDGV